MSDHATFDEFYAAYLAAHRDQYWTAPFIDIMRWVRKAQADGTSTP